MTLKVRVNDERVAFFCDNGSGGFDKILAEPTSQHYHHRLTLDSSYFGKACAAAGNDLSLCTADTCLCGSGVGDHAQGCSIVSGDFGISTNCVKNFDEEPSCMCKAGYSQLKDYSDTSVYRSSSSTIDKASDQTVIVKGTLQNIWVDGVETSVQQFLPSKNGVSNKNAYLQTCLVDPVLYNPIQHGFKFKFTLNQNMQYGWRVKEVKFYTDVDAQGQCQVT